MASSSSAGNSSGVTDETATDRLAIPTIEDGLEIINEEVANRRAIPKIGEPIMFARKHGNWSKGYVSALNVLGIGVTEYVTGDVKYVSFKHLRSLTRGIDDDDGSVSGLTFTTSEAISILGFQKL